MQALQGRTAAQSFHLGTANLLGARPWPQQRQGRLDSRRHKLGFESSRLRPVTTCSTGVKSTASVTTVYNTVPLLRVFNGLCKQEASEQFPLYVWRTRSGKEALPGQVVISR